MGDNNHYAAIIKSSKFNNLNKIEQHKLVYKSLKGKMGNELHALSITNFKQQVNIFTTKEGRQEIVSSIKKDKKS